MAQPRVLRGLDIHFWRPTLFGVGAESKGSRPCPFVQLGPFGAGGLFDRLPVPTAKRQSTVGEPTEG